MRLFCRILTDTVQWMTKSHVNAHLNLCINATTAISQFNKDGNGHRNKNFAQLQNTDQNKGHPYDRVFLRCFLTLSEKRHTAWDCV